jgi:hypothetical protein
VILGPGNAAARQRSPAQPRRASVAGAWLDACSFAADVDTSTFEPHIARALELQVGKARVVVGLDQVDRIVETICTPMPMAHALVRGIGFDDARPIVCVVLSGKSTDPAPQLVTVVLLAGTGPVAWALCADQVHGVVPLVERSVAIDARWPRWLSRVRSKDGRTFAHFNGARLVLDIGGAP